MVEEFIELMELGVLRFPYEYGGQDILKLVKEIDGEENVVPYELNDEERLSLSQIDMMKNEITSIHKTTNAENTSVSYALSKEKESRMHDDRFYTAIMLAHRLYELRRGTIIRSAPDEEISLQNATLCVSAL